MKDKIKSFNLHLKAGDIYIFYFKGEIIIKIIIYKMVQVDQDARDER